MTAQALEASGITVHYGSAQAVANASLRIEAGKVTALVGPNGAGKSTLLGALVGGRRTSSGDVVFAGEAMNALDPTGRAKKGLTLVPQGRQVFPTLSVQENLLVMADALSLSRDRVEEASSRFPILRERRAVPAGSLSGGEQQMLALARALMARPKVLLLDEPTLGLAPVIVSEIIRTVAELAAGGMAILIAEPSIRLVRGQIDRGYVMMRGQIVAEAQGASELERVYLESMGMAGRQEAGPRHH